MIKKNNFYTFEILKDRSGLVHGVSTRQLGDMTALKQREKKKNQERFLNLLGLDRSNLVTMEQIHDSRMGMATSSHRRKEIKRADGLVTVEKNLILAVKTADCASLVAYEFERKILGVAHAGWKGVIKKIGKNLIFQMKKLGAREEKILIAIGPHIGPCCYQFSRKDINQFLTVFGDLPGMVIKRDGRFYLDLEKPLVNQLLKMGLLSKNIEVCQLCTVCKNDQFFSVRKEGEPVGEFLTIGVMKGNS